MPSKRRAPVMKSEPTEVVKCKKHRRYGALRRPRADCRDCWAMWLRKLARQQDVGRPETDDPALMLGPLLPNPYQDEGFDDDVEDNGGPDE